MQDEADHKADGDEDHVDLVTKAEQEFFECIETEKRRRERKDDDEKKDRGKVGFKEVRFICQSITRNFWPAAAVGRGH